MPEVLPLPKYFFVTTGTAVSKVSDLNAFDQALMAAGIGEQNIVQVFAPSSTLPKGITKMKPCEINKGALIFCVLAQEEGTEGETISAGIAYGSRSDGEGGFVAEGHIHGVEKSLREILKWKLDEMAKLRDVEIKGMIHKTVELTVPMDHYGACIAAMVYLF
jgi:arginine decarboxylase